MKRHEIDNKYKWDIDRLIPSLDRWEEDFAYIKEKAAGLSAFASGFKNKNALLKCLKLTEEIDLTLENLYVYSMMRRDSDMADGELETLFARVRGLHVEYAAAAAFITPAITAMPEKLLTEIIADARFKDFDYSLSEILRKKAHVLSAAEEKLLAQSSDTLSEFGKAFSMLDNVDIKFPDIEVDGEKTKLTHAKYGALLRHPDRRVRKDAYEGVYNAYKAVINTITALYSGNVKAGVFGAGARGYTGALDAALNVRNIPADVYKNLLDSVGKNLSSVHEYVAYRQKTLGIQDPKMYDMYVPLVENAEIKLSYEDAYRLVEDALAPLGKDYAALLQTAFSDGWIDVFENENKRSGAYCAGAYGANPYVLLNYEKTTNDIFTIAHELGHAMHSYYSNAKLPHAKAGYEIFVAEVASTVNEVLLLKYLLKRPGTNTGLKKYLLSYYLDMFRTTLFRQTMFAEFEYNAHKDAEGGVPLTQQSLSDMYAGLNEKYYGSAVETDDLIRFEWARIPHFYRAFYVFQYSTGLTAAVNIANDILSRGKPALDRYMKFLSAGGHKSPYEILKDAGVDLCSPAPFDAAMKEFGATLAEIKKL